MRSYLILIIVCIATLILSYYVHASYLVVVSREIVSNWISSESEQIRSENFVDAISRNHKVKETSAFISSISLYRFHNATLDLVAEDGDASNFNLPMDLSETKPGTTLAFTSGIFQSMAIHRFTNRPDIFVVFEIVPTKLIGLFIKNTLIISVLIIAFATFLIQREKRISRQRKDFLRLALKSLEDGNDIELPQKNGKIAIESYKDIKGTYERIVAQREKMLKNQSIVQATQMLAHDVRKPFSLFSAVIDMISNSQSPSEASKILSESIPEITSSLESVNGMIQDIMEVGSEESNLVTESFPISQLISEVLKNQFRFDDKSEIDIVYEFNHRNEVMADRTKIRRVFTNIIGNAAEMMNGKGTIWFKSAEDSQQCEIVIGNSGTFIEPSDIEQLFEAFFTKGKKGGTGLGLAIVRKIVEAHGGSINCRSSREDGTEFILTLPSADAEDCLQAEKRIENSRSYHHSNEKYVSNESHSEPAESSEKSKIEESLSLLSKLGRSLNIAIVDDEPVYRNHVKSHLGADIQPWFTWNLSEFDSSEGLLLHLFDNDVDVIILDIDLGESHISGLDSIPIIKESAPSAKVCVHSNRGLEFQSKAIEAGADLFLPKPISRHHFLSVLVAYAREHIRQETISKNKGSKFPGKVILVEDSEILVNTWRKSFSEDEKFEAFTNFDSFLAEIGKSSFSEDIHFLVTDYYLNENKTGIDVALTIKRLGLNIPVFLSTSKEDLREDEVSYFSDILPKNPKKAIDELRRKMNNRVEHGI